VGKIWQLIGCPLAAGASPMVQPAMVNPALMIRKGEKWGKMNKRWEGRKGRGMEQRGVG